MNGPSAFSGERFLPECEGEILYEHVHRYAFSRRLVAGRRVLDAACGEGYGSEILAGTAESVVGLDIAAEAVREATSRYGASGRIRFVQGSCARLPFRDSSFDAVVSFETVEHLPAAQQPSMIAEFARVLADDGVMIVSSPNRELYSDARDYRNPFHLHELYRGELESLLAPLFGHRRWYRQRLQFWSAMWSEAAAGSGYEVWSTDAVRPEAAALPEAMYFVVVAARSEKALGSETVDVSLLRDAAGSVEVAAQRDAAEALRLDALLAERDTTIARQSAHVAHLEALVAYREKLIEERDRQLVQRTAHVQHLEELVAFRERLVEQRDRELAALVAAREELAASREAARVDCEARIEQKDIALRNSSEETRRALARCTELEGELARRATWRWWARLPRILLSQRRALLTRGRPE